MTHSWETNSRKIGVFLEINSFCDGCRAVGFWDLYTCSPDDNIFLLVHFAWNRLKTPQPRQINHISDGKVLEFVQEDLDVMSFVDKSPFLSAATSCEAAAN